MEQKTKQIEVFRHGATWLRADFHLHTRADSEFNYKADPSFFAKAYFEKLEQENIKIAVITNHNKFDLEEFKELRKWAEQKEIYLLPGIEYSVKDGKKGLHILIVFDDSWIYNKENHNYIQDFIISSFSGQIGYDRPPYPNSNCTFYEACKKLDEFNREFFIIMAHVDDSSGLFNELDGRGLTDFIEADEFKKHVLALQKSRKRDYLKKLPPIALVEGTDSAHEGIDGIGRGNEVGGIIQNTYLKLSAYNFAALKFALRSHENRVKNTILREGGLWIKKLTINPGNSTEVVVPFNAGLNAQIGVRGGGKSSLLEAIRYGLELPLPESPERSQDRDYKEKIVHRLIGNGGLVRIELADSDNNTLYIIDRRGKNRAEVFDSGYNPIPDKRPSDIFQVAYFGQKDLEYAGQNFNGQFIEEKLLRQELEPLKIQTQINKKLVLATLEKLQSLKDDQLKLDELNAEVERLRELQTTYQKHNLQERLELITLYDTEEDFLKDVEETLLKICQTVNQQIVDSVEVLSQMLTHKPKVEQEIFTDSILPAIRQILERLQQWGEQSKTPDDSSGSLIMEFLSTVKLFDARRQTKQEEFESLKREISDPDINVESFREVERKLRESTRLQETLQKKLAEYSTLKKELNNQLTQLLECWNAEFEAIKQELEKFNTESASIKICTTLFGDKVAFTSKLKELAKGSNLRDDHFQKIVSHYDSGIKLYHDFEDENSDLFNILKGGSLFQKFVEKLQDCKEELLTWRAPDNFEFFYNGHPLQNYSLGQRATALTAFILAHQTKDLFLIDQPEDDLDNQTVAQELILQVGKTKLGTQYIFATHNPNIVVLGDSDQIIECRFSDDKLNLGAIAGIDNPEIQEAVINIMEGGKTALKVRTRFYQIANSWKN